MVMGDMKTPRSVTPPVTPAKSTAQRLTSTGFPGLYIHENGTFYGKKKAGGKKFVAPLKTEQGHKITDRKLAERAFLDWAESAEKGEAQDATPFSLNTGVLKRECHPVVLSLFNKV
jgi:hypothetical protein